MTDTSPSPAGGEIPSLDDIADQVLSRLMNGAAFLAEDPDMEDQLEAVYGLGFSLYEQKRFTQAITVFEWLCRHAPLEARFHKALGAARQMHGYYQAATDSYGVAALLDLDDPEPSFHAAQCLMQLGEAGRARQALEAAREQAAENPEHADIRTRIESLENWSGFSGDEDTQETRS